jgi:peptidoglycan hydrolase CwlO-like protein
MLKGVAVLIVATGLMVSSHRPLTKSELETTRIRLQHKIEAVEKKIDRLSRQLQMLDNKMVRLNHGLEALQKHFNIELSPQEPEAVEETLPLESELRITGAASPARGGL